MKKFSIFFLLLICAALNAGEFDNPTDFLPAEQDTNPQITVVLAPKTRATVSAEVSGKIVELKKDFGQHFAKDEVLVCLDDEFSKQTYEKTKATYLLAKASMASAQNIYESQANLKKVEAELTLAKTRLKTLKELRDKQVNTRKAKAMVDVARKNLEATEKLYNDKMASNMDMENARKDLIIAEANLKLTDSTELSDISSIERAVAVAEAEYAIAKANIAPAYENAKKELSLAKSNLQIAKDELDNCTIKAPFSGRIVNVLIDEHELVQKGTPLLELVNDSVLRAKFLLPSSYFKKIKKGQKVKINIIETGKKTAATVSHISAVIDPASESFMVYAEVDNTKGLLRVGMRGRFKLSDIEME